MPPNNLRHVWLACCCDESGERNKNTRRDLHKCDSGAAGDNNNRDNDDDYDIAG